MAAYSRRRLLGMAGVVGVTSVSGCLDRLGDVGTDDFSPPPGFTADAIDPGTAFGPTSAMGELSSVTVAHAWEIQLAEFGLEVDELGRFAFGEDRFRRARDRFDSLETTLTVEEEYFDSAELFRRGRVEPRSLEDRFTARQYTMDRREEIGLVDIQSLLGGVDIHLTDAERVDGRLVGVYTADGASFGDASIVQQWADTIGVTESAAVELRVTEAGHLTRAEIDGTFTNARGDEIRLVGTWAYSAFDDTTVETPAWVAELSGRERPDVTLDFEEQPPDLVEVEVTSMEHTDEVAVVIQGEGVLGSVTEPGVIEVPGEAFIDADGRVQPMLVVAQNELRGPVQLEQYWPTPGLWETTSD